MWLSEALRTKGVRSIAISTPVASLLYLLGQTLSVAPIGTRLVLEFSGLVVGAGILAAALGILILPFLILFRRTHRRQLLVWLIISVLGFTILAGTGNLGDRIRMAAFERLSLRSQGLVDAIRQHEDTHGSPPKRLDLLVPEFLEKVPGTGMMAYPTYEFEITGENAKRYEGNPWILYVHSPSGGINFDRFMYFPLQNYPEWGESGWYERIGEWAYYHE